jgi:hypothetical protein
MCRWEYNIKIDLKEVGWRIELDFAGSAYRRVVGSFEQSNECSCTTKDLEFTD